jgi:hypothetical protein
MFEDIEYAEVPELGEVWVSATPTSGDLYDWIDLRPHLRPEYRGLPFKNLVFDDDLQEVWVLSTERGAAHPVLCRACVRRVLRSTSADAPPMTGLVADDPAGVFGWAWCPSCSERWFIPLLAQEVGIDLSHEIDRSGPLPVLVEVFG